MKKGKGMGEKMSCSKNKLHVNPCIHMIALKNPDR